VSISIGQVAERQQRTASKLKPRRPLQPVQRLVNSPGGGSPGGLAARKSHRKRELRPRAAKQKALVNLQGCVASLRLS